MSADSVSNTITCVSNTATFMREFLKQDRRLLLTQYRILSSLGLRNKGLMISDLSSLLHVSTSAILDNVAGLIDDQLAERIDRFESSRKADIMVTSKGLKVVNTIDAKIAQSLNAQIEPMGNDSEPPHHKICVSYGVNYRHLEVVLLLESCFNDLCHKYDLSVLEYRLLAYSNQNANTGKLQDIADSLFVKPAHLAAAVRSLKRRSFIIKNPGRIDRRTASVELTSEGYSMLQIILHEFADYSISVYEMCAQNQRLELLETSRLFVDYLLGFSRPRVVKNYAAHLSRLHNKTDNKTQKATA